MNNYNRNLCLVDEDDRIVGVEKALTAHRRSNLQLHRAFSVFVFDRTGRLLIQKRAGAKLVYPGCYTNTCCSHPFFSAESFRDPVMDCRMHAIERLQYELGIVEVHKDELHFVNRIRYYANGDDVYGKVITAPVGTQEVREFEVPADVQLVGDGDFGECEIDYVFVCVKDVQVSIRKSEVESVEYVDEARFRHIIEHEECSPWMKLISKEMDIFGIANSLSK